MKRALLVLALLGSLACGPRPEEGPTGIPPTSPPPPSPAAVSPTPSPASSTGAVVTLEEPGLQVRLADSGELTVRRDGGAPEEWRLPVAAASRVVGSLRESRLFGPTAAPAEDGGAVKLSLQEGDVTQVRAPREGAPDFLAAVEDVRALVPRPTGSGPDDAWIAGELVHQDLEGGTWKLVVGPGKEYVLATFPEGFQAGQRVIVTGSAAKEGETVGIHMAGPYYEVLTMKAAAAPPATGSPSPSAEGAHGAAAGATGASAPASGAQGRP